MQIRHLALVSEESDITPAELTTVAAALQKQVVRDFAPLWNVQATVSAFARLEDVPVGYWPIIIKDEIHTSGGGIHLDRKNQPYALVRYEEGWSLTASHECIEMLADPSGNHLVAGMSPRADEGRVEFLVEVCDPCESEAFSYMVNGVVVSDFYTPHYFDPFPVQGVRYSYTGSITQPRQVLRGGYLSWHNPRNGHWYQAQFFDGTGIHYVDLGVPNSGKSGGCLREIVDGHTMAGRNSLAISRNRLYEVRRLESTICESTHANAVALREAIAALRPPLPPPPPPQW